LYNKVYTYKKKSQKISKLAIAFSWLFLLLIWYMVWGYFYSANSNCTSSSSLPSSTPHQSSCWIFSLKFSSENSNWPSSRSKPSSINPSQNISFSKTDHSIISSSLGIIVHQEHNTAKNNEITNKKTFFLIEKIYTKNKTDDDINKNQKYAIVFFGFALKNKLKKINCKRPVYDDFKSQQIIMEENKELSNTNWNNDWNEKINKDISLIDNINKNYKILYTIFFKYWIFILIVIIATITFIIFIKKKSTNIVKESWTQELELIKLLEENKKDLANLEATNDNLKIIIKQWNLDISDTMILSYNNLISFKGLIMPRWTFLDNLDTIKEKDYFGNWDYDTNEIEHLMKSAVLIDYDAIWSKSAETNSLIGLKNNNIDATFSTSCANRPRLFNKICDEFINNFLNSFYVYNIDSDIPWTLTILRTLIWNKKYKNQACESLDKYFTYANKAPSELEDIVILCWQPYLDNYYIIQDFSNTKNELENKYIKQNVSKYKDINDYKLVSFQQILYNNIEQWIPPSEWLYKYYTNYLINILKQSSTEPIDSIYYDMSYRFNNWYIIPKLNKLKYQSTSTKRNEIESIIASIEKINNWSNIDWYLWLKYMLTNKWLEEDIKNMWWNITSDTEDTMSILLKSIKKLSYIKLINDEIVWNTINVNWYFSIQWIKDPVYFWAELTNKNWSLIVSEIDLNWYDEINNILWIIIQQKDNSLWEIYEFIQKNIWLYNSQDYNITPCDIIENKLNNLNIKWLEFLLCNENKVNITKWESWSKILYQFNMDNYNIQSVICNNKEIQDFINKNYSNINTNSANVWNTIEKIISYEPTKQEVSEALEWNNKVITALEDFKTYLWVDIVDIAEQNGKVAAEFTINSVTFVGIYDTTTKELWPLYLKQWNENNYNIVYKQFSLYLKPENQNEINRFLLETYDYLYEINKLLTIKYLSKLFEKNLINE